MLKTLSILSWHVRVVHLTNEPRLFLSNDESQEFVSKMIGLRLKDAII